MNHQDEIERVISEAVAKISVIMKRRIGTLLGLIEPKRREPVTLEATALAIEEFVTKHPKMRIEAINQQLGTTTKQLRKPMAMLMAADRLKRTGYGRAGVYSIPKKPKAIKAVKSKSTEMKES